MKNRNKVIDYKCVFKKNQNQIKDTQGQTETRQTGQDKTRIAGYDM